jgi:hypothetical protein
MTTNTSLEQFKKEVNAKRRKEKQGVWYGIVEGYRVHFSFVGTAILCFCVNGEQYHTKNMRTVKEFNNYLSVPWEYIARRKQLRL